MLAYYANQSSFKKDAPRIAKDLGLKDQDVWDVGGGVGHLGGMSGLKPPTYG